MPVIDKPIIGGGPDFIPQQPPVFIPDDTWRALATQPPARVYVSTQGDWWDMISLRVYGMRRWDDHLMHRLIEANYPLRQISHFPAGIAVTVPEIEVKREIPLVPWKKATLIPNP